MRWSVWEAVEPLLERHGVRPILAVIPDNRDPALELEPARADFWERVRAWQARGYSIALHGYQHRYVNRDPGILRQRWSSEFAGLSREEQRDKLVKGLDIFRQNGVRADCWVAPCHSFVAITLDLLAELGIPVVSDGMASHPYRDRRGLVWVPCQVWSFEWMGPGVWTICQHHNQWDQDYASLFPELLEQFAPRIIDLPTAVAQGQNRVDGLLNRVSSWTIHQWQFLLRPLLGRLLRRLRFRPLTP